EDPADSLAAALRNQRSRALRVLGGLAQTRGAADAGRMLGLLDFYGLGVDGRPSTAKAMQWVKDRPAPVRYLRPGGMFPALGVRAYVLGPPRDRVLIRRSDPSKADSEVYEQDDTGAEQGFFAAAESQSTGAEPGLQPFERFFRLTEDRARRYPLIENRYYPEREAWRRIDDDWLGAADQLALKLD